MNKDFDRTMWRMLADNLPIRAEKIAAIDRGGRVTYAQLAARAGQVADWLIARGIQPGDRVVIDGADRIREGQVVEPIPRSGEP